MDTLQFNLVENAFDFFLEAIECLQEKNPRQMKYAVLHMTSAVELILKARLAKEHWTLICKDPSKVTQETFRKGKFVSVDFPETQDRLKSICIIDLSKYKSTLQILRDMRNRIQHFAFSGQILHIQSILVKAWSFLWDFIHDWIPEELPNHHLIIEDIKQRMIEHETFITNRMALLTPDLEALRKQDFVIVACPSCLQKALVLVEEEDHPCCHFCRYQNDSAHVVDDWATTFIGYPHTDPKDRMISPVVKECPSCMDEAMIEFEDGDATPPDPAWVCFSCGASGPPMVICHTCGAKFPWEGEVYTCPECREERSATMMRDV